MTAHAHDGSFVVGFTGTQHGMTNEQSVTVAALLGAIKKDRAEAFFVHGACVGADEQAAMIAGNLGFTLVAQPGDNPDKRTTLVSHITREPMDNLRRNAIIVGDCDILIACPGQTTEITRSGTWATIRAARRASRLLVIVSPNGDFRGADGAR